MLYVPANDGMLHAFYAGANAADPLGGKEAWAFMPTAVLPNLYKLADTYYKNHHEFFVDGTPVVGDVFIGGAWKTILVAGLNGGGRSYYALDITDPANPIALWEFNRGGTCYSGAAINSDCHLGYTYGKPVITKIGPGAGTWVVLVTSGYNNVNSPTIGGDGVGYLYVLDAANGRILQKISTGAGSAATPSGLAQINVFVDYALYNNLARAVYGGDLLGNVWRFDVNDSILPAGKEAALLGVAKDPGGVPQPITTRPELAELGGKPMVFVGTGQLLGATDFASKQIQSVYGIVDKMTPGPVYPGSLRTTFKPLEMVQGSGSTRTVVCTGSTAQCGSADGWVVDLVWDDGDPLTPFPTGERVNVQMVLARGTLVFASNIPSDKPCDTGGTSWLNYLSFATGLPVSTSGSVAAVASYNSLATGVTVISIKGKLFGERRFSDATNDLNDVPFDTPPPTGKRISWREIAQ
jgi:type IV pilus assembly protein PilY1